MKKRLFIVVMAHFCAIITNSCQPETYDTFCTISGTVSEVGTNDPIQGVDVTIQPAQISTKTGDDGTFYFKDIDAGQLRIQAQKEGYETNTKNYVMNPGETRVVDISLRRLTAGK